jgi:hypothetical protein
MIAHKWLGGVPKRGKSASCIHCDAVMYHQQNHIKVYTSGGSDVKTPVRPNCKTIPMPKEKMRPHTLDVQEVADMLERDNCPASMGAFTYPDGSDGVLMILAKPEYTQRIQTFLQTLYDEVGYVSPQY